MSKPPQTRGTGRSQAIGTVKDRMLAIQSLKDELMTKDEEIVLSNKPPPYVAEIIANAVDNLPLLIAVVTENGDVTYASQRFSVIDGIRSDLTSIAKLEMLFPVGLADRIEQLPLAANYLLAEGVDLNMHHTDGSLHTYYVVKTLASPSIMRKGHLGDAGNHMIIGMDVTADRQAQHSIKDHKS